MLHRVSGRPTRLAAAIVVLFVAMVGLPRPALAAESYVGVYAFMNAQALAIGTEGKEVSFGYAAYSVGGAPLPSTVTVKVDTTSPAGVVSVKLGSPSAGCTANGGVFTCTKNTTAPVDPDGDFALVFTAGPNAQVGSRVSITFTVSAPGVDAQENVQELLITESGPDLRARAFTRKADPGGTVTFRPTFKNQGDLSAETVVLTLSQDRFAELTNRFSNCHYSPEPQSYAAVCVVRNADIDPGQSVQTTADLSVKVSADVPGRTSAWYFGDVFANGTDFGSSYWAQWPTGNGAALAFESVGGAQSRSDADYVDSQAGVLITTPPNPSDVVAVGASAKTKVGDTLTVKLGLTNKGPGFILGIPDSETSNPDDPKNAAFVVTFPAGVEVTGMEMAEADGIYCRGIVNGAFDEEINLPGRSSYRCMKWSLAVNETHLVTFTVKITGTVTAAGSVVARGGVQDLVPANNTAKVDFNESAGLPITGVNVALAATVGAVLIAAGFVVFRSARRRRAVFVTE